MKPELVIDKPTLQIFYNCFYPEDGIEDYYTIIYQDVRYELPSWFYFPELDTLKTLSETEIINSINTSMRQCLQDNLKRAQQHLAEFESEGLSVYQYR